MAKQPPHPLHKYVPQRPSVFDGSSPNDRGGIHGPGAPAKPGPLHQLHGHPEVPDNVYQHVPEKTLPAKKGEKAPRKPLK